MNRQELIWKLEDLGDSLKGEESTEATSVRGIITGCVASLLTGREVEFAEHMSAFAKSERGVIEATLARGRGLN